MLRFALAFLQVAAAIISYLEKQRLIKEGERRQIQRELAAVARAAAIAKKHRDNVEDLSDEEVDARLSDDFRP